MSAKKKPNKVPAPAKPEGEYQEALTEAELQEVKKQARPGIAKMLGTSFALAVIGGGALAGGLRLAPMLRSALTLRFLKLPIWKSPIASPLRFTIRRAC